MLLKIDMMYSLTNQGQPEVKSTTKRGQPEIHVDVFKIVLKQN